MNYIEFSYETEDGLELNVKGQGRVVFESNYGADHDNHKGYPMKYVADIKYNCTTENYEKYSKVLLSDDDKSNIEDIIHNMLVIEGNEVETESDYYDRFND